MSAARRQPPRLLVITGLSGSGKTHVSRALEDAGWFCVDNLPTALVPSFADLIGRSPELRRSALVVDVRERGFPEAFPAVYRELKRRRGLAPSLVFLEADEKTLLRRFSETRRPHPLAGPEPAIEGIRAERAALGPVRKMADVILDTSRFTVHQLRDYVRERYDVRAEGRRMAVSVLSFGYKHGVPPEADIVFDARFLPNPNFVPAAAAAERRRRRGRRLPPAPAGDGGVPAAGPLPRPLRAAAARARGAELSHDRARLHGRAAPLGDAGERGGGGGAQEGPPGARLPPGPEAGVSQ